jgi:two-component system chemotaxis sensor kinase CheA
VKNPIDLKEFVAGFLLEADEHLHSVNRNLVDTSEALKKNLAEPRAIRELFRSIHTIKGLASMVGADPIVDITHEMESILRLADRGGGKVTDDALNLLLEGTRAVEERIHFIAKNGVEGIALAPKKLVEALALEANSKVKQNTSSGTELNLPAEIQKNISASEKEQMLQAANNQQRVLLIEFQPSAEKASHGHTITSVRDHLGKLGNLIKVIPKTAVTAPTGIAFLLVLSTVASDESLTSNAGFSSQDILDIVVTKKIETEVDHEAEDEKTFSEIVIADEGAPSDHSTIRVDVKRLDDALERLSELVVTRYKLIKAASKLTERGVDTRELNSIIADHTRQLKRLRTAITESRMVPLTELLQRIPLVVRGLTKDSGKSVNVVIQASSAEVDKAVADKIFPAIIHLVRNAVDHALETADERKKNNKEEAGTLTIMCDDSSGTSLLLTIKDDGRGIDKELVAKKAGKPVAKNAEELLSQITIPGLSTRDNVTHTSGRGMGMDIVKKTVETLGGVFSLKTEMGEGTTFTLKVPVSVTIIDVFSFISDGQTFVAPIAMIDEIIELEMGEVTEAPVPAQMGPHPKLIQHRGNAIPLFALDSLLNKRPDRVNFPKKALIVHRGEKALAFAVDKMIGQQEVVVRPLDGKLFRVPGMSGATDLGDGLPTLVLDLVTLGAEVMNHSDISL